MKILICQFDVSVWFKSASHQQSLELMHLLGEALNSFGNKPKDEYQMVFGVSLDYFAINNKF